MIELKAQRYLTPITDCLGKLIARGGISATIISVAGLLITSIGAIFVATGYLLTGSLLVGIGASLDAIDGAVARESGSSSAPGAILDSICDRTGETFMWAGLAYYLAGEPLLVTLAVLSLGFSVMTSYLRARAEALGIDGRRGWMARPERVILYVLGVASGLFLLMLWLMVALNFITVLQRLYKICLAQRTSRAS
jgi:CDP-diacylglycerol--glycerol-3-phosphate 3-phosphatidyltransferase